MSQSAQIRALLTAEPGIKNQDIVDRLGCTKRLVHAGEVADEVIRTAAGPDSGCEMSQVVAIYHLDGPFGIWVWESATKEVT